MNNNSIEFSFSGLKTSLLYFMNNSKSSNEKALIEDVAASYQEAIIDVLIHKLKQSLDQTNVRTCVIAGGVAANNRLRRKAQNILDGISIHFPDINYCTDNAAMVSFLGEIKLKSGYKSNLIFNVSPNLKLN